MKIWFGKRWTAWKEGSRVELSYAHSVLALDKAAPGETHRPRAASCGAIHAVWALHRPHR